MNSDGVLKRVIQELTRLPGIGQKTAQRLAFFILGMPAEEAKSIAHAIIDLKDKGRYCSNCNNITEDEICEICKDSRRDQKKICVVEEPSDLYAIERTKQYQGLYHVLLGALSPLDGIGPEDIRVKELLHRIEKEGVEEVIIATNPNTKGEATALYISRIIRPLGIKVTRLAYGLPMGGDLEFADEVTLTKALEGRREI
ncbi:MAG: recombination protein RecR [Nitrospirae bacterium]|nr:recombination protein RecR [Nitrospirota bacterium]